MSQAYGPAGRTYAGPPARPAIPPAVRKYGPRGALFAVVVSVALLLGALVMGFVLVASGEPRAIGIGIVLATLPVGPLVAAYFWLDRYEPEPTRLLVLAFAWGALVATGAALVLQAVEQMVNSSGEQFSAIVMAPLTEEAAKGFFVLLMLWLRRHVIDGLVDALVYAGLVGVGFAFTENILYFAGAYTGGPDFGPGGIASATSLFVLRGVLSPFAHPLFTSATALGVAVAVTSRSGLLRLAAPVGGYLAAVVMHAWWNGSAFLGGGQYFLLTYVFAMVPGFLAMVSLALWGRAREGRLLARAMHDLTRYGYLSPAELPALVSLRARRGARRQAAAHGGPEAGRLVREYQQQAVELATLHNRVMRGTAPAGSLERGTLMLQRLTALRLATGWLR
ncbi:PrsW family intramembrane metalloprotease [Nocardioides marmoribigeumensis]|uniref:RsiW-degrading membrane proteinase PrsW (M82 family) n=1 Tax=Nocardioides marmoribigeumensis TaxID=433649 RepID=A0ABU2C0K9_9ACTN|nr:PrsW family intramembrane metalloprotease [Nocardioides marmoribigeumensis]MDR7364191.1 RsiW-degrading membrane proteinase PrsW (M82 family) [Nocardioides marmoribigeumensis]